jgi:16S rRNA (cytidine1402-2'-O)-methyltransferase
MTPRAVRVLRDVDLIAAEDTRHSRPLLRHFGITTRLVSYHQHNKKAGMGRLLAALDSQDVALISDAGTPAIADPGFELVRAAVDQGHRVEVLPGPSAVIPAVALAALPARGFIFMGFLPGRRSHVVARLAEVASLPYTLVIFEAPHRLDRTLSTIIELLGDREAVAVRELSKLHEQVLRGRLSDIRRGGAEGKVRGEWTLVIAPSFEPPDAVCETDIARALNARTGHGRTPRDAVTAVAKELGLSRSRVYRTWVQARQVGQDA